MDQELMDFYKNIINNDLESKVFELIEQTTDDDKILKILLDIMEGDLND